MGRINRHPRAPFVDGEQMSGADLETDVARMHALLTGNVDDENIADAADIAGSKLLAGSVPGSRIKPFDLATAKMADDALTGIKLADGTLQDDKLAANAVSSAVGSVDLTTRRVDADPVQVEVVLDTVAFTVSADAYVVVAMCCLRLDVTNGSFTFNYDEQGWLLRLKRDAVEIGTRTWQTAPYGQNTDREMHPFIWAIEFSPPAGAATYAIAAEFVPETDDGTDLSFGNFEETSLVVFELKR